MRKKGEGKTKVKCKFCGKEFEEYICHLPERKHCSRECYVNSMKGKPGKFKGEKHYAWEGGKYKNSYGYWILNINRLKGKDYKLAKEMAWKGNKITILEHRFLIAKKIGRPLTKNEVVHHKNGIKDDNRIENLELLNLSTHSKGNLPYNSMGICPKCSHSDIIENFICK